MMRSLWLKRFAFISAVLAAIGLLADTAAKYINLGDRGRDYSEISVAIVKLDVRLTSVENRLAASNGVTVNIVRAVRLSDPQIQEISVIDSGFKAKITTP
jgi:hypothetical protein